jgi:rubrerythrin
VPDGRAEDDGARFRVAPSLAGAKQVFLICHYCGHDQAEVPADGRCPKCGGHSWERYALSVRLLPHAAK